MRCNDGFGSAAIESSVGEVLACARALTPRPRWKHLIALLIWLQAVGPVAAEGVIQRSSKMRSHQTGYPVLTSGCGALTQNDACSPRSTIVSGHTALSSVASIGVSGNCPGAGVAIPAGEYDADVDLGNAGTEAAECFKLTSTSAAPLKIHWNNHTVHGAVCRNGNLDSLLFEYGSITANNATGNVLTDCGGQGGAFVITNAATCPTGTNVIHDMTLRNTNGNDTNVVRVDISTSSDCARYFLEMYRNDCLSPPTGASRVYCYNLQGNAVRTAGYFYVHEMYVFIQASSFGAQGISVYASPYSLIEKNHIVADCTTTAQINRLISVDAQSADAGDHGPGSNHTIVNLNDLEPCDGRAIRIRASWNVQVTNNYCHNLVNDTGSGIGGQGVCLHGGDPDANNSDMQAYDISGNTFELGANTIGIMVLRNYGAGGIAQNNTYTCAAGGCSSAVAIWVKQPTGTGTRSEIRAKNETISGLSGNYMKVQYGRTGDSSPLFTYCNVGMTPVADSSVGTVVAPTITLDCS